MKRPCKIFYTQVNVCEAFHSAKLKNKIHTNEKYI